MRILPFTPADAAVTARLFHEAVRIGAAGAYTEEQLAAWSPEPPDVAAWCTRLAAMTTFVAWDGARAVGFMSLNGTQIDLAFVPPDQKGKGIADALYTAIIEAARATGCRNLATDASIPARRFFEKQGWRVVREQRPVRNGVALTNYRMEIRLQ